MKTTAAAEKPQKRAPVKPRSKLDPLDAAGHALANARVFAEEYGNVKRIADQMNAITEPNRYSRQIVGLWLNENPEKRDIPTLGNALVLLAAVEILHAETLRTVPEILTIRIRKATK
jgi:hypothetical protein